MKLSLRCLIAALGLEACEVTSIDDDVDCDDVDTIIPLELLWRLVMVAVIV